MAKLSNRKIRRLLRVACDGGTPSERGRAYEDLVCYVFGTVPGVSITARDQHNVFHSEELDVAFWNERHYRGFSFWPEIILVEAKNWSAAVASQDVQWFIDKLRNRGLQHGVLVTASGITGAPGPVTSAHHVLSNALRDGIRIVVLTSTDLEHLHDTTELILLVKQRMCDLVVSGASV